MGAVVIVGAALTVLRAQVPARDVPVLPSATGAVRGRVIADAREPIRKARVDLVASTGDRRDPVYADSDGRFAFTGVPAGRYTLSAWKSGYVQTTFGARTFWEPAAVIALEPGQSVDGFDIALARGASISGRVVDDAGEPLSDMEVTVGWAAPVNGRLQFQGVAIPTTTDDRGEYRVGGLPPGTFVVNVFGWAGAAMAAPGSDSAPRPRSVFYPQTPFVSQARSVVLRAGEEAGSVDVAFTADSLVTPTISGRVIDPRGLPIQAGLLAMSAGDGVPAAVRGLTNLVRPSGEFSMRLAPGDYTLTAQTDDVIAMTRIAVDRSDLTGVELVLVKGARISGRVVFDGTAPRPPDGFAVVAATSEQPGGFDVPRMGGRQPARIRADGSFTVSNLIGTFELRVMPEARGWRPKSIMAGGRSLFEVPIDFKSGEDLRDVLIVMTDRSASLTGTVVGASSPSLATGISVLVFPNDGRQAPHRARWVRPDQNGRFVVSDLSPGDYLVAPATDVDDLRWQTAAYLERFRLGATRVTLGDGEMKSISLEWTERR